MALIDENLTALSCGGRLTVDLNAIKHNYLTLVKRAYPARVSAVVKANAYGLGIEQIAPILFQAGCRDYFVAELCEAFELTECLKRARKANEHGQDYNIYILNGFAQGSETAIAEARFIPVLNSLNEISDWRKLCIHRNNRFPALIQIDTGMARLGLDEQELDKLICDTGIFSDADILYLLSHLAVGDEVANPENEKQRAKIVKAAARLPKTKIAFANSGGIFLGQSYCFDLVRPGLALYGVDPMADAQTPIQPVVKLEARVLQLRLVGAGVRVGYGGTFLTQKPTLIATIGVGYADGLHRQLGNKGSAYFKNTALPIIGRISMDSLTLDATALVDHKNSGNCSLKRGDFVELIGPNQTLTDLARDADTIAYEILTSLGRRYDRHYRLK